MLGKLDVEEQPIRRFLTVHMGGNGMGTRRKRGAMNLMIRKPTRVATKIEEEEEEENDRDAPIM